MPMTSLRLPARLPIRLAVAALLATGLVSLTPAQEATPPQGGPPPGMAPGGADGMPQGMPQGMPPGMPPGMGPPAPVHYRAVVDIGDGTPQVDAALLGGHGAGKATARITGTSASGLQLRSTIDELNGLYVHGKSAYTLSDSSINLAGHGRSDFEGIAAGVLARDDATLVLRNVHITTAGVVSAAATVTDGATLKVYQSTLVAHGGPVTSGYVRRIGPGMMEPPTPLGITGTARTTLAMGRSHAYYYDSTIDADGWGALSTDAARGAYLEANHCVIRTLHSGYGTYADNGSEVVINDSTLDNASFNGIIAGQASMTFNGAQARSRGYGVMIHSVMGETREVPVLKIRGGRFDAANGIVLVKSANLDLAIDGTAMHSGNGDLLMVSKNDDANATRTNGKPVHGVHATFRNMQLSGNVIDKDPDRGLLLGLESTSISGRMENVSLTLDARSHWTASADSSVDLGAASGIGGIDAGRGVTITATADQASPLAGRHDLPGGGVLVVSAR